MEAVVLCRLADDSSLCIGDDCPLFAKCFSEEVEDSQGALHRKWVEEERGIEGPTHLETLLLPEQKHRINWLFSKCLGVHSILDIGCNTGYILDVIRGELGVDINPDNIALARAGFPHLRFEVGDITKGLDFLGSKSFTTVILAEVLEHLDWSAVFPSLDEALRIAMAKLLITLPWRKGGDCRDCFKHRWAPNEAKVGAIVAWLMQRVKKVNVECDGDFVLLEVIL